MELISREQAIEKIEERIRERELLDVPSGTVVEKENREVIEELKYIKDVVLSGCDRIEEKKKSRWKKNMSLINVFYCEACGHSERSRELKYCSECGAEMER